MQLEDLVDQLTDSTRKLAGAVSTGERLPALGLRRAARLPVLAALYNQLQRPLLLLTDRADHALTLFDELSLWLPEAAEPTRLLFPEPNPLFYERAAWGVTTRRDRLAVLTALAVYQIPGAALPARPPVIVAPARALMTRTLPRREFLKATRTLKPGQAVSPEELARQWVELGYESVNTVIAPGQFARRGGLLDVWPPADLLPARIELFGDEIDTLRRFDPATQRTLKAANAVSRLLITPAREFILRLPDKKNKPSDILETSTTNGGGVTTEALTALPSGGGETSPGFPPVAPEAGEIFSPSGPEGNVYSEFDLPVLHPTPASLLDYLPSGSLVLIDDRQALADIVAEIDEQAFSLRKDFIADGTLPQDFPSPYLSWSELDDSLTGQRVLELGYPAEQEVELPLAEEDENAAWVGLAGHFTPGPRFGGRLKSFIEHLVEVHERGEPAFVVSRQTSRLEELWKEQPAGRAGPATPVHFINGSLAEGWTFTPPAGPLQHLLTDGEIFGWRRPEPRQRHRPSAEAPEAQYADLQPGDYVVHADHGIGRFAGLVNRTIDGAEREYLCVEYANEAQLFVPVHQADRLTRYVGPDGRTPGLSTLGSVEWRSAKAHVKEAVQEVAEDLLELYATRSLIQGYTFAGDTAWQQELEGSFPYVETEDQLRVIAEVKRDMENPRPMDRLICGDVGYGKTEVALRAAFKAVMDGRQVALLVPTTVLAQQHYQTFTQRLAAFPVEVEMLSRFRSQHEQKEILRRLAEGGIDILIGTHRLLSSDVEFKDLGLLIIDEEQRFGVSHKEKLKQMRTEVDVLTLTATPIPRTLYMALTGVRDISTINTPPEERLPIVTHVGPYSPRLARQAILRELERGGQVFFVHNRVQTIGAMRNHLEKLVPEARITVAHGQMAEHELSERMRQFTAGEVDVLLSTSIIESGLDIPNANTLIVDRADTFGLAQLYQLRGRVGRGAQRAYTYFFRHNKRPPTQEGRARLETIAENTQLGAGYSIAMRDLEIRGTGDILGTRQHGHIAAVGFHLYTRLLSDAVRRLRGRSDLSIAPQATALAAELPPAISVDLPLAVGLPADYVPDKNMRLRLYRRLANTRTLAEVDALQEEFIDRFGPLPEAAHNLLYQLKVKLLAEQAGLSSINPEGNQFVLRFPDGAVPWPLPDLGPAMRVGKAALWMSLENLDDWQRTLLEVLEGLGRGKTNDERRTADDGNLKLVTGDR